MNAHAYHADEPLALIAGAGSLPEQILTARSQANQQTYLLAIEGTTPPALTALAPYAWCRIAAVGQAVEQLREWGVSQIVMAGSMKRPSLRDLVPDELGKKLLKRLGGSIFSGDDALLRTIMNFLEEQGFHVVGAHEICTSLLTPKGTLTRAKPNRTALKDRDLGLRILHALAPFDVGQAVIVCQEHVLGIEGREGTADLIARCAALKDGTGGVLVKTAKAGQELRADMPAVGMDTISALIEGGYAGMSLGAGESLMLGEQAMIQAANKAGLFIEGIAIA